MVVAETAVTLAQTGVESAELVLERAARTPATAYTKRVANEMRQRGILLNFLGIHYNVLKIRPPMPFSRADADRMIGTLDSVLRAEWDKDAANNAQALTTEFADYLKGKQDNITALTIFFAQP